jgi:hypothetical protein
VERAILGDPDLPGTVLRLPMIYGPGDRLRRFHPVLKRIDDGRRRILFEEGWANWRSPRGYVDNVAAAIALAAVSEQAAGRVYNVAEQPAFTELEWARKIAAATGWDGEFAVLPKDRMPIHLVQPGNSAQHWEADSSRIRRELGYREPVPLDGSHRPHHRVGARQPHRRIQHAQIRLRGRGRGDWRLTSWDMLQLVKRAQLAISLASPPRRAFGYEAEEGLF